jgi:hypothetical protein
MSLIDAVKAAADYPPPEATQAQKKRYSERLSQQLAFEVADGLRNVEFPNVRPARGGPGERAFQGGLGPKKVDVTYADARHGLLLAVSIKSISVPPYGKNLKNRFADLCTEAITLHMRFPYSVICGLFAFPIMADEDVTRGRPMSTFRRALKLLATISGRANYTDPGEKFESVTGMLFQPIMPKGSRVSVRLFDALTEVQVSEQDYFRGLKELFNRRNPHVALEENIAPLGED